MKPHSLNRKIHDWGAMVIAPPVLIIISTGLLLLMKKQFPWVQPLEKRGQSQDLRLTFPQILAACRPVPEASVETWSERPIRICRLI